ncbi:hypothetical protein D6D01_00897 [Aureobasidium pullulans]|uniref:Uncharacterized protein n=1 Tax=Aureobasidium pullulans TaxID=5580 RepID=A0A4V4JY45_AURPU|nr:hypothetical protein D6D01_00897 [Aureobasidium pullulans]
MVHIINWSNFRSDGDPAEYITKKPAEKFAQILANTVSAVNSDPYIKQTYGSVSFTSFPPGYAVCRKPRIKEPSKEDPTIFGNPKGPYSSAVEFAPHVVSIIKGNGPGSCSCVYCDPKAWKKIKAIKKAERDATDAANAAEKQKTRGSTPNIESTRNAIHDDMDPAFPPTPMDVDDDEFPVNTNIDEDGTPNVLTQLLDRARTGEHFGQAIAETGSMHYLLENEAAEFPDYLKKVKRTPRWQFRLGEVVLVARNLKPDDKIRMDDATGILKIFSRAYGPVGLPIWEAAVVTQLYEKAFGIGILDQHSDSEGTAFDGYRVEPVSEIGTNNKPWSTRYQVVDPLNMRPFSHWRELIHNADLDDPHACHPTVRHALFAMSSVSGVSRYHFTANGQEARFFFKGMYLGAEFLTQGDVVRFSSPQHSNSFGKDVLHIKHMYMSVGLGRDPEPISFHVEGIGYTVDRAHAHGNFQRPVPVEELPFRSMRGYGLWYKMSADDSIVRVNYARVLTRLGEDAYMKIMVKDSHTKVASGGGATHLGMPDHVIDITYGLEGVVAAREHSSKFDPRIKRSLGRTWYFADNRVEQLDLQLINGHDVGGKARFGFESAPQPLQEAHLKSMFRARAARRKAPAPAPKKAAEYEFTEKEMDFAEAFMDKFEAGYTQRQTEDDFDEFISEAAEDKKFKEHMAENMAKADDILSRL